MPPLTYITSPSSVKEYERRKEGIILYPSDSKGLSVSSSCSSLPSSNNLTIIPSVYRHRSSSLTFHSSVEQHGLFSSISSPEKLKALSSMAELNSMIIERQRQKWQQQSSESILTTALVPTYQTRPEKRIHEKKVIKRFKNIILYSDDEKAVLARAESKERDNNALENEELLYRVIQEIYETEVEYVDKIRSLQNTYVSKMEEDQNQILNDAQAAVFFSTLKQIVTLNGKFLDDLSCLMSEMKSRTTENHPKTPTESLGLLFCRYAPLFQLYSGYAKDYNDVSRLLEEYFSGQGSTSLNLFEPCTDSQATFHSLLILPVQRVPRYKLFIERAMQYTATVDKGLAEALSKIEEAANLINEAVRRHENMELVLSTQARFGGQVNLYTKDRVLIKAGKMLKVSRKRPEEVAVHLFNDLLIYSDALITGGFRLRRTVDLRSRSCSVRSEIPLSYGTLYYEGKELRAKSGFMIVSAEKSFLLFCSSQNQKRLWVASISDALDKLREANEQEITELPKDPAAPWVPDSAAESCTLCKSSFRFLFRRHHCRKCGAVVCGNCSSNRSVLVLGWENGKVTGKGQRVCTACFRILELVRRIALKWMGALVKHQGWMRRKVGNKWTQNYYTIDRGFLKEYAIRAGGIPMLDEPIAKLQLAEAVVIHLRQRDKRFSHLFQVISSQCFQDFMELKEDETSLLASKKNDIDSAHGGKNDCPLSTGWTLCAADMEDEKVWVMKLQEAADYGLYQVRKSSVHTDCKMSYYEDRLSSGNIDDAMNCNDEQLRIEHKRRQILKEIVRSETNNVQSLKECIEVFVQPLLIKHQEGQKLVREARLRSQSVGSIRKVRSIRNGAETSRALRPPIYSSFSIPGSTDNPPPPLATLSTGSTRRPMLLDADMAVFFNSIEQIYILNQQFLEHLKRHLEESESQRRLTALRIGAIFNVYAPLFQLYTAYASRYERAVCAIKTPEFMSFLEEMPKEASLSRLQRYLNMPVESIPRYKAQLAELEDVTDAQHVDYMALTGAKEKVNAVVNQIHENIMRRENKEKIMKIEKEFGGISLRKKQFVFEGFLRKICRKVVKRYRFVLFADALLYGHSVRENVYKAHRIIDLWKCKVTEDTSSPISKLTKEAAGLLPSDKRAFCFYSAKKSFVLIAATTKEKKEWVKYLQQCIRQYTDSNHTELSSSENPEDDNEETLVLSSHSNYESPVDDYIDKSETDVMVIKNGWLTLADRHGSKRYWITLMCEAICFSVRPGCVVPESSISLKSLQIARHQEDLLEMRLLTQSGENKGDIYYLQAETSKDREEWFKLIRRCVEGEGRETLRETEPGLAPILMYYKAAKACTLCENPFLLFRRRHHCHVCGRLVCSECSKTRRSLPQRKDLSRVCDYCVKRL